MGGGERDGRMVREGGRDSGRRREGGREGRKEGHGVSIDVCIQLNKCCGCT